MGIDWKSVEKEVTGYLQDLLRFDTTNPPGNEILCAKYIADVLKHEGLDAPVTESEPGRGNVTATLRGGDEPTLMLLGHTDVVAAEPDKWSRDPFGGDLHDGCVWGRGALDMKNMVAVELMVFLLLKRQGIELNRDVIYAATADEEAGKGNHGIGWLIENHPEQVDARYVITEGGGADFFVNGKRFYTCQTGQKGIFRFRLVAKGDPGHASIPHHNNAIVKLGRALDAIGQADWPVYVSPTLKAFFDAIAPIVYKESIDFSSSDIYDITLGSSGRGSGNNDETISSDIYMALGLSTIESDDKGDKRKYDIYGQLIGDKNKKNDNNQSSNPWY